MPAIITHDTFGQDLYEHVKHLIGDGADERDAFLLGNQGPDPLFYIAAVPWQAKYCRVGSHMHDNKPSELIYAFRQSLEVLSETERSVGAAYLAGFLGHYSLDSTAHPLIFWNERSLCNAGVPGLTRDDHTDVHAVIETEIDEVMLYTRRGQTVATFAPESEILRATDRVLDIISKMYCYALLMTYGDTVPRTLFTSAVYGFRIVQGAFHSKSGRRRDVVAAVELKFRPHSFFRAMSHRAIPLLESPFENRAHDAWENPFTGEISRESFPELYAKAQAKATEAIESALRPYFSLLDARAITCERNFSGEPVVAIVTNVE